MKEGSSSLETTTSVTITQAVKGSHDFIIHNYSLCKEVLGVNKSIGSDYFTVGGYEWQIRFFPNGNTIDNYNDRYVSLHILLMTDTNNSVPIIHELQLLDQSGNGNHHCRSTFNWFPLLIHNATFGVSLGVDEFITQDALVEDHYLKDNCLKIHCNLQVLTSRVENLCRLIKAPEIKFQKLMRRRDSDVDFEVEGETFRAHKSIIIAHSNSDMLKSYLYRQDILVIANIEPTMLKALLWFIYTATLLEEEEQEELNASSPLVLESYMGKMLAAADRFGLKRLREIYESRILEKISVESVAYLFQLAEHCHATVLKEACLRFAAENRAVVLESNGAGYLKEVCPSLFLELAGNTKKPSLDLEEDRDMELEFYTKIETIVKAAFGRIFSK